MLLYSKDPKGRCYVETKNLDGETNLKMKIAHKDISKHFSDTTKVFPFKEFFLNEPLFRSIIARTLPFYMIDQIPIYTNSREPLL